MANNSACDAAYYDLLRLREINTRHSFLPRNAIPYDGPSIEKILRCKCDKCKSHALFFATGPSRRRPVYRDYSDLICDKYKCLFALLVYIRFPALIIHFANHRMYDEEILTLLGAGRMDWGNHAAFESIDKNKPANLAILRELNQKIEDEWTNFLRPKIEATDFGVIRSRFKLPIYDEKPLGSGNSGIVFSFKIYDGYNDLPDTSKIRKFACKQMSFANTTEREALKLVNQLNDKHIVRLLTSFEHAKEGSDTRLFNLIFPKATTNLENYLRNVEHDLGQQNFTNVFAAPIWFQTLGIMTALQNMHNNLGDKFAVHLDMKPANILVDLPRGGNAHFMITDFGLSSIRDPARAGSSMPGAAGDEAYGPPERKMSRKYDIWSMACILLEILTYTLDFEGGIKKLDDARTIQGSRVLPFYEETPEGSHQIRYRVNSHIDYLQGLTQNTENVSPRGSWFVRQILLLIKQMFSINPDDRPVAREASQKLQSALREETWLNQSAVTGAPQILFEEESWPNTTALTETPQIAVREEIWPSQRTFTAGPEIAFRDARPVQQLPFQPVPRSSTSVGDITRDRLLKEGWTEMDRSEAITLAGIVARSHWSPTHEDERVGISVWQNRKVTDADLILVVVFDRSGKPPEALRVARKTMNLVPAYALRGRQRIPRQLAGIRFQHHGATFSAFSFDFDGDLNDLRMLQGMMMQQDICYSVEARRVVIERPKVSRFKLLSRTTPSGPLLDDSNGLTVQLWRAYEHDFGECRIVIYTQSQSGSRIWVTRFSDSLGFERKASDDHPEILVSYLNRNSTQIFFSHFDTEPTQKQPSLPLDPDLFNKHAREHQEEFGAIQIHFYDAVKRNEFLAKYRVLKQTWEQDLDVRR